MLVETSGIGQGDAAIVPHADATLYVMTPEYGAASQLEKIDMLDFADFVAINKFDRKGAADALRDVSKQVQRNKGDFSKKPDEMMVFGTQAARFNDDGVTALYQALLPKLKELGLKAGDGVLPKVATRHSTHQVPIVPPQRTRYLAEISDTVRGYKKRSLEQSRIARQRQQLAEAGRMLADRMQGSRMRTSASSPPTAKRSSTAAAGSCSTMWPQMQKAYAGDEYVVKIRDREVRTKLTQHIAVGQQDPQGRAAALRGPRRIAALDAARKRPRQLPLHRRRVRVQARERGPDAHVRGRGRPVPHQQALQAASAKGCRPSGSRPRSTA